MTPRRLIVTADDLGASVEVNEAVARAATRGILRFASLMVCGDAAEDAVRRVRERCPGLGLGLHLVLCSGRSALGPALGDLVDGRGMFPDGPARCGWRYYLDRGCRGLLERELRAQFERFLGFGLEPGHADSHANIHVHPVVFPILARLCGEYGFKRVRLPGGEFAASSSYAPWSAISRAPLAAVFGCLRPRLLAAALEAGLEVPDRVWGLLRSGAMTPGYVAHCLARLEPGTTELYLHPSTASGPDARRTHRGPAELEALTSPGVAAAVRAGGITLVQARQ